MTFTNHSLFYFSWILPLLAVIIWHGFRRRSRILTAFGGGAVERDRSRRLGRMNLRGRRLAAVLYLVGLGFLIFALAGPRMGYTVREVEQRGVDVIIALDCSRSMLAGDVRPDRLSRAKREIEDMLGILRGDRIGLIAFAGTAFPQCPLTSDYNALRIFLDVLGPDEMPVGGTDLARAVDVALSAFPADLNSDKGIILITDGQSTEGYALEAAQKAADMGVRIYSIGMGAPEGAPVPDGKGGFKRDSEGKVVMSRLDEPLLRRMAETTGGAYVRSESGDMDLEHIYAAIRREMEARTLSNDETKVFNERYQWPLGLALLSLCAAMLLSPSGRSALMLTCVIMPFAGRDVQAQEYEASAEQAYIAEDYSRAMDGFLKKQIQAPDDPRLFYNIGNTYYRQGDFEGARKSFLKASESDDLVLREKSLYNLGNSLYRKGNLDGAIESYEQALEIDPDDVEARKNLEFVRQKKQQQGQQNQQDQQNNQGDQGQQGDKGQDQDQSGRSDQDQSGQNESGDDQSKAQQSDEENSEGDKSQEDQSENGQQGAQDNQDNKDQQDESGESSEGENNQQSDEQSKGDSQQDNQNSEAGNQADDQSDTEQDRQDQPSADGKLSDLDPRDEQGDASANPQSGEDRDFEAEFTPDEQWMSGQPRQMEPGNQEPVQAVSPDMTDRILDGMEDKPGRALMPGHKTRVVRDW